MSSLFVRLSDDKVRLYTPDAFNTLVRVSEIGDDRSCKCCAEECSDTLSFTVEFCGMVLSDSVTIPSPPLIFDLSTREQLPNGSYMFVVVGIACTPCGWEVGIGVCAGCGDPPTLTTGDTWVALIDFADEEESPGAGHCPVPGEIDLECFGEQFGIPCNSTVTASIS